MIFYTNLFIPARFDGINRGPISLIRPACRSDYGLAAHENVHARQFWRSLGVLTLLYAISKTWRQALEVEAYRVQLACYPDDRSALFAGFLETRYNLDITQDQAIQLLKEKQNG